LGFDPGRVIELVDHVPVGAERQPSVVTSASPFLDDANHGLKLDRFADIRVTLN
jgi:hypothetical protein